MQINPEACNTYFARSQMLRIRMVEEEIARRYPEGRMRTPVHLSVGQEACAVGVCSMLNKDDICVSTHRSHAHYLAMGGDLNAMIAELHGKATGCSGGFGGSMHLADRQAGFWGSTSIVSGMIPVGVGMAFARKLQGKPGKTIILHGDAAEEEGVYWEAVNFAGLHSLPVLFVCEDNQMSCFTGIDERQAGYSINGVRAVEVGGKLASVQRAAAEILLAIEVGPGPRLLRIQTRRYLTHCGVANDDALGYRDIKDLDRWRADDEIAGRRYPPELYAEIAAEIKEAFDQAEAAPWPTTEQAKGLQYA